MECAFVWVTAIPFFRFHFQTICIIHFVVFFAVSKKEHAIKSVFAKTKFIHSVGFVVIVVIVVIITQRCVISYGFEPHNTFIWMPSKANNNCNYIYMQSHFWIKLIAINLWRVAHITASQIFIALSDQSVTIAVLFFGPCFCCCFTFYFALCVNQILLLNVCGHPTPLHDVQARETMHNNNGAHQMRTEHTLLSSVLSKELTVGLEGLGCERAKNNNTENHN